MDTRTWFNGLLHDLSKFVKIDSRSPFSSIYGQNSPTCRGKRNFLEGYSFGLRRIVDLGNLKITRIFYLESQTRIFICRYFLWTDTIFATILTSCRLGRETLHR